ncbi:efflux transporter outer membrane subunit [Lampropedia aestuarii]|uniref:efflux transporter outer membrane subunit n=1 Tax=Lampropedia aestuarii TaxID=2562762 RepID=UPI002468BC78|nr:efflux transporter outer membrane subunit [Lampropedia aestuarii]MDH5858429.1 efflux transporter outer membrane subunit [Lampropedia aestuarii]
MAKQGIASGMALACSLLITGCATVGPDFQSPQAASAWPAQFARATMAASTEAQQDRGDQQGTAFWRQFGDAQLSALVQQALHNNQDLAAAAARLQAAQALLSQAQWQRWPSVTMQGNAAQQNRSAEQMDSARSYSASIHARWELDWWGRIQRAVEAEQAQQQATQADLQALQVLIAAQVADSYVQLRGLQQRLAIAMAAERNQHAIWQLVERRLQAGSSTELDRSRAQAQWQATQAQLPPLQQHIARQEHRLAVLLGRTPNQLIGAIDGNGQLPQPPAMMAPGTPADVLRRRPDIAAAEARLHAATARVGVATADLFPSVSLGAVLGSTAFAGRDVFSAGTANRSVLLGIDWTFLDAGRVRARIAASEAGAAEQLANYQQQVLLALEEVENALVQLDRNHAELQLLQSVTAQRNQAEQLAQRMFQAGTASLFDVLETQREQLNAQDAQAQSQVNAVRASIALYQAIASDWTANAEGG